MIQVQNRTKVLLKHTIETFDAAMQNLTASASVGLKTAVVVFGNTQVRSMESREEKSLQLSIDEATVVCTLVDKMLEEEGYRTSSNPANHYIEIKEKQNG